MARKKKHRPLAEELRDLWESHPASTAWSARAVAEHLGRNESSVKRNVAWQEMRAEIEGVELSAADVRALTALDTRTGDGSIATSGEVAKEARLGAVVMGRRLAGLRQRGYATSIIGNDGGYQISEQGQRFLRSLNKPKKKKKR